MLKKRFSLLILVLAFSINVFSQTGAYYTGVYRNLFKEHLDKTDGEIQTKIDAIWDHFFVNATNKVYNEVEGTDMAYIFDTGNEDVRTEGMSYGMMICVQLDRKAEFDKLWKWAKTYMQYGATSDYNGYFAWQCNTDGTIKGNGPASDGEAYFITALFFAAHRWGNGTGIYDYEAEAQDILNKIMSKTGVGSVYNLFNTDSKLITFVPYGNSWLHTDPSYSLPAFFELWAEWSTTNKEFLSQTPAAHRALLKNSSHPTTGLFPDYASFDGQPFNPEWKTDYDAKRYQYDALRCALNVGMDYSWFGTDAENQTASMTRLLTFFKNDNYAHGQFDWDGANPAGSYSEGMAGANGVGAMAVTDAALAKIFVERLWNTTPPSGQWRYYNGMVYFLSILNASGNFKIFKPAPTGSPTVSITAPISGSKYITPASFTITAIAADADGSIESVDFYNGDVKIATATTEPYTYTWTEVEAGSYTIRAVATDNEGNSTTSSMVVVSVTAPAIDGTIVIRAQGVVGTEIINLEIDGKVIDTWTVTTDFADYKTIGNVNGKIRVNYTNDDGQDRDIQIDYITVSGTKYEAENQAINTGFYANGACGGGGNSQTMHCSGYIEFVTNKLTFVDECPTDPNKTLPGECGCDIEEGTCELEIVDLKKGWNLIGCPLKGKTTIQSALASIWNFVEIIKDENGFYQASGPTYLNSLSLVKWGKGYWINVSSDCTLDWIAR